MTPSDAIAYDVPAEITAIDADLVSHLAGLRPSAVGLCRVAQGLLIPPDLASGLGVPDDRQSERSIRRAGEIVRRLVALHPAPVHDARSPDQRVIGTCRHFTVLAVAFLRFRGIAARARCGFATYFDPGNYVDHWVVEYWHDEQERWVRVDAEMLGFPVVPTPDDLGPNEFYTGGEAWELCRDDGIDPMRFGVHGVEHAWGIAEIRGNAIRDLAALNKVEMLPWDEWGRMEASYKGETGADYDRLVDEIAAVCAAGEPAAVQALYASEDLTVPPALIV